MPRSIGTTTSPGAKVAGWYHVTLEVRERGTSAPYEVHTSTVHANGVSAAQVTAATKWRLAGYQVGKCIDLQPDRSHRRG